MHRRSRFGLRRRIGVTSPPIEGHCDPRFARVREVFAANFAHRDEHGAAVALVIDGRPAVDLWGGWADRARARAWRHDTIVNVFSTTKGIVALCAHHLADRGRLDFDAPVASYWPEFARAGKASIPARFLLSHRAGLPAIAKPLATEAAYEWTAMVAALEEQEPWWEPGTVHGYHAMTFGWLVGELIRRISGQSPGAYLREEIATPLGLDCHIGLNPADDARCAEILGSRPPPPGARTIFTEIAEHPGSLTAKAFGNPPGLMRSTTINSRRWRAAEIPAANGHTNARSLARLYGALAIGGTIENVRLLGAESVRRCFVEQSRGTDTILLVPTRFSLGFMLSHPDAPLGPNPDSFGHPGAGGSIGFADPAAKIGFGYVMNRMGPNIIRDPRAAALIDAAYLSIQK